MVIKSYIYHRINFRKFFLQLIPILTLLLHSNSFIMVFNMRVVPVSSPSPSSVGTHGSGNTFRLTSPKKHQTQLKNGVLPPLQGRMLPE